MAFAGDMLEPMLSSFARLVFFAAFLAATATAQPSSPAPVEAAAPAPVSLWPAIDTDLPVDPALVRGELPNGLRYVIFPNAEPKDKVSLRLLVRAGSLHENDDERGLAHFVEHMAFRGTRAFPAGSMTAALQRLGVGLGPESTAFTTYDHTIYHLELPDAKEATLQEGLRAFREYAEAVTFDDRLIVQERGVVLNEMATRDTPDARSGEANLNFLWPGSRETRRKPIGDPALLRRFTRDQFVAFYDAWYRPDRMAVVVVGAIEPAAAERLVAEHFGGLRARAPARPEPPDLFTREAAPPNVRVFTDPAIIGFGVSLEQPIFAPIEATTRAQRERDAHQSLAFAMLRNRLMKIATTPDASFVSPTVLLTRPRPAWKLAVIAVSGRIDDWRRVASEVEREHRRAFLHGFTERELAEARGYIGMMYEQLARSASTRPSSAVAQQLVGLLLYGGTFATPEVLQRDVAATLESATKQNCLEAFRAVWGTGAPSVFVTANPAFNITRTQITEALNESRRTPVDRPPEAAAPTFAYADFGPAATPVHEEHLADLDVRLSRFANNVRLNFKQTPFEADIVDVRVRFGTGKLSQPEDQPGLDTLADAALVAGGLGRHSAQELGEILSSHAFSIRFQVLSDACSFWVRCSRHELPLALKVLAAFLTDASFRPDTLRETQARLNTMYASLDVSPSAPILTHTLREIYSDRRLGLAIFAEMGNRTLAEVEAWLRPQLKSGALELSLVGDIAWEEAVAAVGQTLGALPERAPVIAPAPPPPLKRAAFPPPGGERTYVMTTAIKQVAIGWHWPVPVLSGYREDRRCRLLAAILMDRLRLRLRDEIGATYALSAGFTQTNGVPDLNYFSFYVELDPTKKAQVATLILREVADLRTRGPSAEEFERMRQPFLRAGLDHLRTNAYWGGTVLFDAQQRPNRLEAARNRTADNAAITREELHALARTHLDPNRAFKFVVVPAALDPRLPLKR